MKTRKMGKMILALLLAVMMVLPSVAAMAEAVEGEPSYEGTPIDVTNATVKVYDFETRKWSEDEELTESMKLEGDLTVDVENVPNYDAGPGDWRDDQNALTVDAEGTEKSFEVTGSVSVDIVSKNEDSWADASVAAAEVSATSATNGNGGSADLTVGGGISASVESTGDYTYSYSYGLYTYADDGSTVKVTAGGDVSATTVVIDKSEDGDESEDATSAAVQVQGSGDTTIIIDGSAVAEATAPEGIANAGAVLVNYGKGPLQEPMNEDEEESTSSITVTVKKDATATATVGDKDDTEDSSKAQAGSIVATAYEGQTVEVTVDGKASAEATNEGKGKAGAIAVNATVGGEDAKVTYTVSGDVIATATGNDSAEATGINVEAKGKNETNITVNSVTATATLESKEDEEGAEGAAEGGEANPEAEGVMVKATDGATVNVTVGEGGINASGDKSAMGIYATTSDAESSVKVTVQDGGVVAEGAEDGWVMGVNSINRDGEITVNVIGDTVSSVTGIYAADMDGTYSVEKEYTGEITHSDEDKYDEEKDCWIQDVDGEKVYYKYDKDEESVGYAWTEEEKDDRKGGTTKVTVVGDVQAEDTAVELELTEAKSKIEVTVDGTVEGKEHAIVLSEDTIAKNLTMTVWEVKPNEDGNIVERVKPAEDGEGEPEYTADKETEKLIQYIVRIQDDSKPYIATTGTRDFTAGNGETYQVANEGDKVLVKLTIPEGKELVGAYWDVAQSDAGKLLTDSEGNYYVEVPRGGGVELSLVMKDIPEPEPEPQPEPVPETAKYSSAGPILTLKIQDGKVRIDFYRNGSFVVTLEDGSKEKGTYAFENDQLVLNCGSGKVQINADEPFTYTSSADASRTYQFKMSQADIETLKKK